MINHDDAQHQRDLEHARWQVSFVEFRLQTHRSLTLKDDDWQREEKNLVERLDAAKQALGALESK